MFNTFYNETSKIFLEKFSYSIIFMNHFDANNYFTRYI